MRSMGNEAIKAGKQIQSAGKTITSVGSTLTKAITVPIAGVATAAVKTAADFEAAMSEVGANIRRERAGFSDINGKS